MTVVAKHAASADVSTPEATRTVANAAGPHWCDFCGKNGVAVSSVLFVESTGPRATQPQSTAQMKMAKHAVGYAACFAMKENSGFSAS